MILIFLKMAEVLTPRPPENIPGRLETLHEEVDQIRREQLENELATLRLSSNEADHWVAEYRERELNALKRRTSDLEPVFHNFGRKFELDVAHPTTPEALLEAMKKYQTCGYELGAKGEGNKIDCSGLVTQALLDLKVANGRYTDTHNLYSKATQLKNIDWEGPEKGDLVFWVSLENGKAIHMAVVNQVLEHGVVRITQSAEWSHGYNDQEMIDLKDKRSKKEDCRYAFGRPVFYG